MSVKWTARTRDAERLANQAWDELVAAVESGGDTARTLARRTADLADEAQDRFGDAAFEARRRALAARDALAGRQPAPPWGALIAAAAAGAVIGWLAAVAVRRAGPPEPVLAMAESGSVPEPAVGATDEPAPPVP
jgi:ElaB/YqjD/DUF883 family membrane-anchored ribosome-binding protein